MQKIIVKKLPNGVRVVLVPRAESVSVTSAVFVEAGAAYETKEQSGISHFLEHMCFKGTTRRPTALQISTELENLGASYNAFTDFDLTGYYATVAAQNFEKSFDVIADMYLSPLLEEGEIKKEKGVIVEEIRMYEDLPRHKADETLDMLMYGPQPAGRSIAGTEKTVNSFTRSRIHAYRNAHYVSAKTIVVIAGNINPQKAYGLVRAYFSKTPKRKRIDKISIRNYNKGHISIVQKKLDQSHFMAGCKTVPIVSKERPQLSLLATALGGGMSSRLFQKIREEMGAAYYIGSRASFNAQYGAIKIMGGINHGKLEDVFAALIQELRKIREGITKDELIRAKEFSIGNFLLSLETPSDLGSYYGYQMATIGKAQTPQEVVKQIKKVTAEEIRSAARTYFTEKNFYLSLVGPHEKADERKYEELYKKAWK